MSKDPARIDRMIEKVREVWHSHPDQRLGQLISNARGLGPQDIFYYEDSDLEKDLDAQINLQIERKKALEQPDRTSNA